MATALGVGLLLLTALPLPVFLPAARGADPQTVVPGYAVVLAALLILLLLVAGRLQPVGSRWLAVAVGWVLLRTLIAAWERGGVPLEALLPDGMILAGALLYAGASDRRLTRGTEMRLAAGLLVVAAVNAGLGLVNLLGHYPAFWPQVLGTSLLGRVNTWLVHQPGIVVAIYPDLTINPVLRWTPLGLLQNPNFWGLLMAAAVPTAATVLPARWSLRWWGVGGFVGLVALSHSRLAWAVTALELGLLVWSQRRPTATARPALRRPLAAAALMTLVLLPVSASAWTPHLGGRLPVWELGLAYGHTRPLLGHGPGAWSAWATAPDSPIRRGAPGVLEEQRGWAASWLAAFCEPLQVYVEFGAIGLLLVGWLVLEVCIDAATVWPLGDPLGRLWALLAVLGGVAMWASIPFRVPILALTILFAAARLRARVVAIA